MQNPEPVLENETQKILWDFDRQTDHRIVARQSKLVIVNKKQRTYRIVNFNVSVDHRVKLKEGETRDKYLDLARELKKQWKWRWYQLKLVRSLQQPKDWWSDLKNWK